MLAYTNSCVNPILYAFLSDNFRKAFRKVGNTYSCFHTNKSQMKKKIVQYYVAPTSFCENGILLFIQGSVKVICLKSIVKQESFCSFVDIHKKAVTNKKNHV